MLKPSFSFLSLPTLVLAISGAASFASPSIAFFDSGETSEIAKPNVLLIVTDEHNFRTLGCYRELMSAEQAEMWGPANVVKTPHLDQIAAGGVICTRAYATAPVCSPCRASMFTGRYPHATGVPANDLPLDRTIPTIADRLNKAGYRTGYVGKWHLGGKGKPEWAPKIDGGFQFKKFMFNRGHWKKFLIEDGEPKVGTTKNGKPAYGVGNADSTSFATDWLTDRTIDFINNGSDSKPFLAVLSYPDPHGPNTVRAPYDGQFTDMQFVAPRTYKTGTPVPNWLGTKKKHPVFRGKDMSQYFGMVQCLDDNVGRLIAELKRTGKLDNTLIVMTSDHGDLCYEHDRLNKGNPYEGSARVPMMMRLPNRIAAKQVYKHPVGTVDITPTIMGMLNLAGDPNDQGRDLSSQLADVSSEKIDAENPPVTFLRNAGKKPNWVAAIDARYKLILSVNDDPWLFDMKQDPDELVNLYRRPGTKGVAERLGKALRGYGIANADPYLSQKNIASSLERILATSKTELEGAAK